MASGCLGLSPLDIFVLSLPRCNVLSQPLIEFAINNTFQQAQLIIMILKVIFFFKGAWMGAAVAVGMVLKCNAEGTLPPKVQCCFKLNMLFSMQIEADLIKISLFFVYMWFDCVCRWERYIILDAQSLDNGVFFKPSRTYLSNSNLNVKKIKKNAIAI